MSDQANHSCPFHQATPPSAEAKAAAGYVAINTINCKPHYRERFECLFCSRAHAIDRVEGFIGMHVLKCETESEPYLIVSYWRDRTAFDSWVGSPEFIEGHKRGFDDLAIAKARGEEPPMTSEFRTYSILTD
jgi:heme-degrading monooxygenase HmoA